MQISDGHHGSMGLQAEVEVNTRSLARSGTSEVMLEQQWSLEKSKEENDFTQAGQDLVAKVAAKVRAKRPKGILKKQSTASTAPTVPASSRVWRGLPCGRFQDNRICAGQQGPFVGSSRADTPRTFSLKQLAAMPRKGILKNTQQREWATTPHWSTMSPQNCWTGTMAWMWQPVLLKETHLEAQQQALSSHQPQNTQAGIPVGAWRAH